MKFQICSRQDLPNLSLQEPAMIISITSAPIDGCVVKKEPQWPAGPSSWHKILRLNLDFEDVDDRYKSDRFEFFQPYHANQILDFVAEGQRQLIDLCICQCDAGISRSAGTAAALSYILTQDDFWVFKNPRYMPNRLVYRTILDVYYRDNPHPPYYKLEKSNSFTYLGSMTLERYYDLYLHHNGDGDLMVMARYGKGDDEVIFGDVEVDDEETTHLSLYEARRRVHLKGLLDPALF